MMPDDFIQELSMSPDGDLVCVITNYLFKFPLYGFYVFVIVHFEPDEIEGMLMTCPVEEYGPYPSLEFARDMLKAGLIDGRLG